MSPSYLTRCLLLIPILRRCRAAELRHFRARARLGDSPRYLLHTIESATRFYQEIKAAVARWWRAVCCDQGMRDGSL